MKHLKYFKYMVKHKWFVLLAGRKVGVTWRRLLVHDLSKFSHEEWTPYANRFFSGRAGIEDKSGDSQAFSDAWKHHYENNDHHCEHWVCGWNELGIPTAMPYGAIKEMIADWMGAGRAITGSWDLTEWYNKTKNKQLLSRSTRIWVEKLLVEQGYDIELTPDPWREGKRT